MRKVAIQAHAGTVVIGGVLISMWRNINTRLLRMKARGLRVACESKQGWVTAGALRNNC